MIIEIEGIGQVEVDDAFAELTPTQQNQFVEQIRREVELGAGTSEEAKEPAETQRIRSIAQGATLGFADELEAALRNPASALGSALGLSEGKNYKENLETIRKKLESYRSENPIEALAYEMGGAGVTTLGLGALTAGTGGAAAGAATSARLAPLAARAAAVGAAEGGVAGFGAGEGGFQERLKSAGTGALIGGTVGAAAPIAVQQVGKTGRRVMDALGVGGQKRAMTFSERKMLEAFERDGLTPEQAMQKLEEARGMGIEDITPADLGENLAGAGWRAQATPSGERSKVAEQFVERRSRQAEQISEQAKEMSGAEGATGIDYLDDLAAKTQAEAQPAYAKAYEVELDAQPFQNMAKSKVIQDAYDKALRIADIDPDVDVSGMPKDLSKFFGEEMQGGGYVGMPTELAHEIKKGLDVLIEGQTDAVTNKVTKEGRALVNLKNRWNSEIIDQNDAYRVANEQFADNARLRDAYTAGFDFTKISEKELVKRVGKMTPPEKEALRVGLISQVEELASKTGDATYFVNTVFGTPRKRAALRLVFDDPAQFEQFERFMKFQAQKMKTTRKVMGGSATAERMMQAADADIDPSSIFSITGQLATGNVPGALQAAGSQAAARAAGMSEKSAAEMSRMLFETDPAAQRAMVNRLMPRQAAYEAARRQIYRRPEAYSGIIGATGGLLAGRSE